MAARRVLVVEDDLEIRESLVEALAEQGYRASGAVNGAEALAQLRQGGEPPCAIVLDLMMPVMDGRAFREAQLQDPALSRIPVLLVSAYPDAPASAAQLHAQAWLKKPFPLLTLVRELERLCQGG